MDQDQDRNILLQTHMILATIAITHFLFDANKIFTYEQRNIIIQRHVACFLPKMPMSVQVPNFTF